MATTDLVPTGVLSATGWTGATAANLSSSNDVRATGGDPSEFISCDITNSPGDFGSQNSVVLKVEARTQGSVSRPKQVLVELRNSSETVLESFTTTDLTGSDVVYTSSTFTRSDSQSVIDGYRLRCTVQEGGGMPDSATVEIDDKRVTLDYNPPATNVVSTLGTLTLAGFTTTVRLNSNVVSSLGTLTLAGLASAVKVNSTINSTLGTLTLTPFASTAKLTASVNSTLGTLTLTPFSSTVTEGGSPAASAEADFLRRYH